MSAPLSPLIHLIDDDDAVRAGLALLIGTVGLRVQAWADPQAFMRSFDRQGIGAIVQVAREFSKPCFSHASWSGPRK